MKRTQEKDIDFLMRSQAELGLVINQSGCYRLTEDQENILLQRRNNNRNKSIP
jgi:hypothetical protein